MTNLINGDARHIALADESVQCIITSPPYWGLRDYGTARWEGGDPKCDHVAGKARNDGDFNERTQERYGKYSQVMTIPDSIQYRDTCPRCGAIRIDSQIGLERVPDCLGWATGHACGECYVCHIVAVMRECWRVLRSDGTCWLNLGDSYAMSSLRGNSDFSKTTRGSHYTESGILNTSRSIPAGLKPKDLCLIPSRVALALQAAGWYVRSEIIWHKPNPMPESVTDRPTKAHEMIYLLTKRAEYYYDAIAIQESAAYDGRKDTMMKGGIKYNDSIVPGQTVQSFAARGHERWPNQNDDGTRARNRRSVWTVATSPYSGAHFATFPPALVEPMILAGTSQRGACPTCGKAWRRVVDKVGYPAQEEKIAEMESKGVPRYTAGLRNFSGAKHAAFKSENPDTTLGFAPACACYGEAAPPLPDEPADTSNGDMAAYKSERARLLNDVYPLLPVVPCKVFDPFSGSGTVLRVAIKHGRIGIGNDLNLNYAPLTVDRTSKIQTVMPL